ncbi:transposase [Sorangium sp. So ce1389]|uniref:transposase n=1 Tax=Sorangium sp. So ce1389 TaxID=3133336 RepID=UPI003F6243CD
MSSASASASRASSERSPRRASQPRSAVSSGVAGPSAVKRNHAPATTSSRWRTSASSDLSASSYRTTGAGEPPHPPALMCMVTLLQGYVGASDAEAVELSVVDLRWQMVLGCLGAVTPPFSQGALQGFRERMVAHETDRVLLERTVALVRSGVMTDGDRRAVPKALRVSIDSRPLAGAGRVEETINLLGHAQLSSLQQWVDRHLDNAVEQPLRPYLDAITQVRDQDQ